MAITYGMSVKEFWEDNPDLFWAYRFSYYEKVRANQEMFNNNAWLQGAYFHEAISVALCNAFSKQKVEYSKHPYGFSKNETIDQKLEQQKAFEIRLKAQAIKTQVMLEKKNKQM